MLKKLSVRAKILGGYVIALLVCAIMVILSIVSLQNTRSRYDTILKENTTLVLNMETARTSTNAIARYIRDMQMNPNVNSRNQTSTRIQELRSDLSELLPQIESSYDLADGYGDQYVTAVKNWMGVADEIVSQILRGDTEGAATRILNECTPALNNVAEIARQASSSVQAEQNQMVEDAARYGSYTRNLMIILFVVSLALLIALSIVISRSITAPLALMQEVMVGMSKGDLKIPCEYYSKDEIGVTADAVRSCQETLSNIIHDIDEVLDKMSTGDLTVSLTTHFPGDLTRIESSIANLLQRLNDVMTQMRSVGTQVTDGAEQVSSGAQALAQGSTEQASSVEELSATLADVAAKSKQNSESALRVRDLANEAGAAIGRSDAHMKEMVSAMDDISSSSGEIGKIIKTIEDIAFQTNILALNAAVEAARAGAAGKGFAVVADEVRNLAAKSAEASKNTARLIEKTISAVDHGASIATETASALEEAASLAQEAVSHIETIAEAANQEAEAIDQVTVGVDQISAVVQTNSATSEESAAASQELSSQAQILDNLLGRFQIGGSDTRFSPASAMPSASAPLSSSGFGQMDFGDYTAPADTGSPFDKY